MKNKKNIEWAQRKLLPFLKESTKELGNEVNFFIFATLVRKMAIKGIDKDELIEILETHYDHQVYFNRSHIH